LEPGFPRVRAGALALEFRQHGFYCRIMKRISFFMVAAALCTTPALRAQDTATQERIDRMAGQIASLIENQDALRKKSEDLEKAIENLRAQIDKSGGNYASQDYVKQLYDSMKEMDRKRLEDTEKLRSEFRAEVLRLGKLLKEPKPTSPAPAPASTSTDDATRKKAGTDEKGYWHVVKKGELLPAIVKAYRDDKKTGATLDQVVRANPGLNPDRIYVGQKIFIPATQP
jgi:nucleoid-associated protein YgaU